MWCEEYHAPIVVRIPCWIVGPLCLSSSSPSFYHWGNGICLMGAPISEMDSYTLIRQDRGMGEWQTMLGAMTLVPAYQPILHIMCISLYQLMQQEGWVIHLLPFSLWGTRPCWERVHLPGTVVSAGPTSMPLIDNKSNAYACTETCMRHLNLLYTWDKYCSTYCSFKWLKSSSNILKCTITIPKT